MGAGAFGPTTYGQPTAVGKQTFINNPGQYQAFNQTPMMNAANANTMSSVGNQQRIQQGQANASGAGQSAGNSATQRDIAAAGQGAIANSNEQAAANSFAQQLGQENANNQFNLGEQQNENTAYGQQAANYNQQQASRQAAISQLPGGQYVDLFGGTGY